MPEFRGQFSSSQRNTLLMPIKPGRVSQAQGMSHVEAYEVIAHLNRIFGFEGWDKEILACELLFETDSGNEGRSKWTVAYKASMRLTVRDGDGVTVCIKEDVSVGDAQNQPSRADAHDLAMKSAVSTALKRCAKDLGDQYGLSLYAKGSMDALVKRVIPYEEDLGPRASDAMVAARQENSGGGGGGPLDIVEVKQMSEGLEKAKRALSNG